MLNHPQESFQKERITPEMALEILTNKNFKNRPIKKHALKRLTDAIKSGEWIVTNQGISFDPDGNLLDGQHRLHACIEANIPIDISVENNSFFNQQNKRFSGININHKISDKFYIGGTLINLSENPLTQKANYGTEPVNNSMIGFNTNFSTEVPFLTRLVNLYPTIDSDVKSQISFRAEIASLIANNPRNTEGAVKMISGINISLSFSFSFLSCNVHSPKKTLKNIFDV